MRERPIPFSAPMVRALLDGSKTQTRRIVKPQPDNRPGMDCTRLIFKDRKGAPILDEALEAAYPQSYLGLCPYGVPGDRLWVREHWKALPLFDAMSPRDIPPGAAVWFDADGDSGRTFGRFRPGMFMPRWASRLTLEVTGVRVERLQDISGADALAEGIVPQRGGGFGLPAGEHFHAVDPRVSYWSLFEAINGPGSVEANPWLWVVEFGRLACSPA